MGLELLVNSKCNDLFGILMAYNFTNIFIFLLNCGRLNNPLNTVTKKPPEKSEGCSNADHFFLDLCIQIPVFKIIVNVLQKHSA